MKTKTLFQMYLNNLNYRDDLQRFKQRDPEWGSRIEGEQRLDGIDKEVQDGEEKKEEGQ